MKGNRFITFGVAIVTVLLIVGSLATQILIVAEAFGTRTTLHAVPVIQKPMAGRDVTVQTRDSIMVVACRDHTTPQTLTSKKNS
jgi:hypothetical protein